MQHIEAQHLSLPDSAVRSLDDARLPDNLLSWLRTYLDPLNFATNFALEKPKAIIRALPRRITGRGYKQRCKLFFGVGFLLQTARSWLIGCRTDLSRRRRSNRSRQPGNSPPF
ncbi:MAG: hypothetical protein R3E60_04135 [Alphaproteobacteria bacterium]